MENTLLKLYKNKGEKEYVEPQKDLALTIIPGQEIRLKHFQKNNMYEKDYVRIVSYNVVQLYPHHVLLSYKAKEKDILTSFSYWDIKEYRVSKE